MTIASLPLFHRISGQPVIVLGTGGAAQAKRRLVERAGGLVIDEIAEGIDKGARLAFVAHDNEEAARGDALRLRCAGLLVNVVDKPELCDFTTPSILDRSPVLIAIGTGGASAGLAKALRLRLEQAFPQSLGALAAALGTAREALRERWPDAGARRIALDEALGEGGALDPLDDESAGRVDSWIAGGESQSPDRTEEIVLTSDDPEDLTLRQARLLGSADRIAHDPAIPSQILDRARADAERFALHAGGSPAAASGLTVIMRRSHP
ncbi:MAG: NAD(P)-dependent oxidoreductase [Sphingomonadaceae bacterium]